MTLGRLVLAWLPVAVWFTIAGWAANRLIGAAASPPPGPATHVWTAVEAAVTTLIASLWFDSLGHGGWWLLFGLFGILATGLKSRPVFIVIAITLLRYIAAGAILSWRLG